MAGSTAKMAMVSSFIEGVGLQVISRLPVLRRGGAFILARAGESALKFPEQDAPAFMFAISLSAKNSKYFAYAAAQRTPGGFDRIQLDRGHLKPCLGQLLAVLR